MLLVLVVAGGLTGLSPVWVQGVVVASGGGHVAHLHAKEAGGEDVAWLLPGIFRQSLQFFCT